MSITRDAVTAISTGGNTSTSYNYNHTCTGTNLCLLVGVADNSGDSVTSVTYNSVAMTQLGKVARNVAGPELYIYGLLNPATGLNNVFITRSNSTSDITSGAVSYTGVKQSGLPDASGTANSLASTSVTKSITTIAANAIAVAWAGGSGGGQGAGTGSTSLSTGGADILLESSTFPIVSPGSYSMTATFALGNNGIIVVSLAPAPSTATGNFFMFMK